MNSISLEGMERRHWETHNLHGIVLWRKVDIKLIGNTTAPVDPDRLSLQPPSAPSPPGQRAASTPTPLAPEKGKKKTSPLPLAGPTNKKQKMVEQKIVPRKKLAYEMTDKEMNEEVDRYVKEQLKPKVPEKRVPVDPQIAAKIYARLNNPPPKKNYPRTMTGH